MLARPLLLVAAADEVVGKALHQVVSLFAGESHSHRVLDLLVYQTAAEVVEYLDMLSSRELCNLVMVWDCSGLEQDLLRSGVFPNRVEQHILLYPEIYNIFICYSRKLALQKNILQRDAEGVNTELHFIEIGQISKVEDLLQRHANGFRPIFDPTGLRYAAGRYQLPENEKKKFEISAVTDDEPDYLFLNGYILYRYGYGVFLASSQKEFMALFERDKSFEYVVEDVELFFTDLEKGTGTAQYFIPSVRKKNRQDAEGSDHLAEFLRNRAEKFEGLSNCKKRIILSGSGAIKGFTCIPKPYQGIYEKKFKPVREENGLRRYDNANNNIGHSVPGILQDIAQRLITRARRIISKGEDCSIKESIHAAVLAEEARRLLAAKTPVLSLEAIRVRHKSEIMAECSFIGTASEMKVKSRLEELQTEVNAVINAVKVKIDKTGDVDQQKKAEKHREKHREKQELNALVEIASDLRKKYVDYEQYEEEDLVISFVNKTRAKLKYKRNDKLLRRVIGSFVKLVEDYLYDVSQSFCSLVFKILLIIFIFAVVDFCCFGFYLQGAPECLEVKALVPWNVLKSEFYNLTSSFKFSFPSLLVNYSVDFFECFLRSANTFFVGPFQLGEILRTQSVVWSPHWVLYWICITLETILGYIHLGIFITYLSQKVFRK